MREDKTNEEEQAQAGEAQGMSENTEQTSRKTLNLNSFLDEFLSHLAIIERDTAQYRKDCLDKLVLELQDKTAIVAEKPTETKQPQAVDEITFNLNYQTQQGSILGKYEFANKQNNQTDKWNYAYHVLRKANATIKNRYQGVDYVFGYWLYGSESIYRQRLNKGDLSKAWMTK